MIRPATQRKERGGLERSQTLTITSRFQKNISQQQRCLQEDAHAITDQVFISNTEPLPAWPHRRTVRVVAQGPPSQFTLQCIRHNLHSCARCLNITPSPPRAQTCHLSQTAVHTHQQAVSINYRHLGGSRLRLGDDTASVRIARGRLRST